LLEGARMWVLALATAVVANSASMSANASDAATEHQSLALLGSLRGSLQLNRPILTGCLAECGGVQECVTQCEVCVEEHKCHALHKHCDVCLLDVYLLLNRTKLLENEVIDSGGQPLVHEGLRLRLEAARLGSFELQRDLRHARSEVLEAQRQAEWTAEERRMLGKRFRQATLALEAARNETDKWMLRHAKKIKAMRAGEVSRLEKIEKEAENAEAAQNEVQRAEEDATEEHAADVAHGSKEASPAALKKRAKLDRETRKEKRALKATQKAHDEQKQDAEWLNQGLEKEVEIARRHARSELRVLRSARHVEALSRKLLQRAKQRYTKTMLKSEQSDKKVRQLELALRKHPLPIFQLEEEPAHSGCEARALREVLLLVSVIVGPAFAMPLSPWA